MRFVGARDMENKPALIISPSPNTKTCNSRLQTFLFLSCLFHVFICLLLIGAQLCTALGSAWLFLNMLYKEMDLTWKWRSRGTEEWKGKSSSQCSVYRLRGSWARVGKDPDK